MPQPGPGRTADDLYEQVSVEFGGALERLARGYEADPDKRRDLLQEIHVALWRSLAGFDGRCSLRTWVYRVAHNTASSKVVRPRRTAPALVSLEDLPIEPETLDHLRVDRQQAIDRLLVLIHQLKPLDRQVMLLYLEGEDAASTGAVTGLSAGAVATKIHRIKQLLARRFNKGAPYGQ